MDPHRNLFYYYRGPSREDLPTWDPQIENNATKALINLMEYTPRDAALAAFLELVEPQEAASWMELPLEVTLQRVPQAARQASTKLPVLLSPRHQHDTAIQSGGRPDCFVYSRTGEFAILVETKVSSAYSAVQLAGHLRAVGWPDSLAWKNVYWEDLYRALASLSGLREPAPTLLRQFLEYLELIGVSPFTGFSEEDFDYFVRPTDDYGSLLKSKLRRFAESVQKALPADLRAELPEVYSGKLSKGDDRGMWVALRPPQDAADPLRHCNFTLELDSEGLSINAVIRGGSADTRGAALKRFSTKIQDPSSELLTSLALGPDFYVRVHERVGKDGGRVKRGWESWRVRATLRLDQSEDDLRRFLEMMLNSVRLPGLHIRRQVQRWDDKLGEADKLTDHCVQSILLLEPVLASLRA